jgi:chemotaxis receptor (MCP) glutamine deamidase CheD
MSCIAVETYDKANKIAGMMEHCPSFEAFVSDLKTSLEGTVAVLEHGSVNCLHVLCLTSTLCLYRT